MLYYQLQVQHIVLRLFFANYSLISIIWFPIYILQELLLSTPRMFVRKTWTEAEDKILRLLRQQRQQKKWSLIAKKMDEQFEIKGRTGKQCRQRYHNHLESSIRTSEWTAEEDERLFVLHGRLGNRWALISQQIPGRSDNCTKNHFYSRLRKALRRLNKTIAERFHKEYREIKIDLLYKIIEIAEENFRGEMRLDELLPEECLDIKNRLFKYGEESEPQFIELSRRLAEDIVSFEQKLRKTNRAKKEHKTSTQTLCSVGEPSAVRESEPFLDIFRRVCQEVMLDSE